MKISNKANLPEAIIKALENDSYNKGECDYSVTELIYKTPKQAILQKKHAHEIEEDAEDMLYRLYGQIAHGLLERANELDLVEKRFFAKFGEHTVSAQIDSLSLRGAVLTDYKFTTAWSVTSDKQTKSEWVQQLNAQLEILRRNGLDANRLQIVALLRDWHIRDAKLKPEYPQSPIIVREIPILERNIIEDFINTRIAMFNEAKKSLPDCSAEETWSTEPIWAVVEPSKTTKSGFKAVSGGLCTSQEGAQALLQHWPKAQIQFRPGEAKRCADYCSVNKFCSQFQRSQK